MDLMTRQNAALAEESVGTSQAAMEQAVALAVGGAIPVEPDQTAHISHDVPSRALPAGLLPLAFS